MAIAAAVLYRRLTRSSLESVVEGGSPMKRASRKALLANRAAKAFAEKGQERQKRTSAANRMQRASREGFCAFVSHMKAEAAMEARFLQIELERETEEMVFLDSDDLRNLKSLVQHVKASRALLLLQTRKVLTRPYCVIEILTAIEEGIPIVGINVTGKHADMTYDFAEMSQLMTWFDTELEEWNPGASDVLRDHGYGDLSEVAYKLSIIIPKTISVSLNTCASRNMLRATIEDIVASAESARASIDERFVGLPTQAEWLAARAKTNRPPPRAKQAAAEAAAARAEAAAGRRRRRLRERAARRVARGPRAVRRREGDAIAVAGGLAVGWRRAQGRHVRGVGVRAARGGGGPARAAAARAGATRPAGGRAPHWRRCWRRRSSSRRGAARARRRRRRGGL